MKKARLNCSLVSFEVLLRKHLGASVIIILVTHDLFENLSVWIQYDQKEVS